MIEAVGRIAAATTLPVTADLEGGYGDAAETVRKAIGVGIVGANLEDQMKPLEEAVAAVSAVMDARCPRACRTSCSTPRTDAFVKAGDRDPAEVLADAVERGRAYLDAGAPAVFVPGKLDEAQVTTLVEAFAPSGSPSSGCPAYPRWRGWRSSESPGCRTARCRSGWALTALQELTEAVLAGGGVPSSMRPLN